MGSGASKDRRREASVAGPDRAWPRGPDATFTSPGPLIVAGHAARETECSTRPGRGGRRRQRERETTVELLSIRHDRVTVELDPRDCYWLAEACAAAGDYLFGDTDLDDHFGFDHVRGDVGARDAALEGRQRWYEALASGLKAAAVAGEAEYHTVAGDHPTLDYVRRRYSGQGEAFPPMKDEPDEPATEEAPPAA